jgi:16S rRNA (adenine1518-N6/adenine1519-N6)-dimethyltransferase
LTSPILFSLLEGPVRWRRIVVMVQKEVADRMITRPGNRTYGALSLKVQYFAVPRVLFQVPSTAFVPPPQVKSCVIALDPRPDPLQGDLERRRRVFALIERSFQHRRKTLPNALGHGGWWTLPRGELPEVLRRLNINPQCRPEILSLEDFFRLEAALHELISQEKSPPP